MIIVVLGPQGSGKGTQAKLLAQKYNLKVISMGDLLRAASKADEGINEIVNKKGGLVPPETTYSVLIEYLKANEINDNFILDGFPRMVEQYELFKTWLVEKGKQIDIVIVLDISEEESIRRLSGRRTDPVGGKIYNLDTSPKPGPEVDVASLVQRDDDKPEAIRQRLNWYKTDVLPLIGHLREANVKVVEIDAARSVDAIQADLIAFLEGLE
ncbi:hypothetical protein A2630_01075 [Candidatus Woesebacteria bacterium RIFCSPHIGHO2_01_FULL_44_10]|uniref:Adenylate kinase n=1 Tax=Candidatus Woesebacteria bacterium RIFCSPLOWO2_01_FULL_44_14 TaxID=1802525 RepID=A0A1F8C237_9BACT|nr:MAG: hypothetical protein A2630_01075 [Candidatus Woesebacteria bacterium RIFCSPHIGHO2_01_FULL_44_10]OGM54720.1 MAG: hypothetical protein A3F62_02860 [Candidatus Woesebacteria bacterium RIFCSPHIGHO2_12_FULL_44_11]OGM70190.1 MAG: hypothetical protein A2975_03900 [Candidatus Woesebacteria bacterium RIFCSPLOWO2_01_FULL_44_14]